MTAAQLIAKLQHECHKHKLDLTTTPVGFWTKNGRYDMVKDIYAGGTSEPECMMIRLKRNFRFGEAEE